MDEARKRILELLRGGRLAVEDAESLLDALGAAGSADRLPARPEPPDPGGFSASRLSVRLERGQTAEFTIQIPLAVLRSGLGVADFIPPYVRRAIDEGMRRQGIGFQLSALTAENVDTLLARLDGLDLGWEGGEVRLRIDALP